MNCICLERIGDNGPCPMHGAGSRWISSLFWVKAGALDRVEFSSKLECHIGSYFVEKGDILTARNRGDGLWALSFPKHELRDFVSLSARDVNRIVGFELIQEA